MISAVARPGRRPLPLVVRLGRGVALPAVAAALLSGCQADVVTHIDVKSASDARTHISLTLTGPAAAAVLDKPDLQAQLERTITDRAGQLPRRSTPRIDGQPALRYDADLDYAHLIGSADVLGVSSAHLSGGGHQVTATVDIVVAEGLRKAIVSSVAGQPDAAVLADTYQQSIMVSVAVRYAGSITQAVVLTPAGQPLDLAAAAAAQGRYAGSAQGSPRLDVTHHHAVLTSSVARMVPLRLQVTGNPTQRGVPAVAFLVAAALVGTGVWWWWRNRRTAPSAG